MHILLTTTQKGTMVIKFTLTWWKQKGFKMFKNMKNHWIFLLDPLKRILSKYKPLLAKRFMDNNNNQVAKVTLYPKLYMFTTLYVICCNVFCIFYLMVWLHLQANLTLLFFITCWECVASYLCPRALIFLCNLHNSVMSSYVT